MLKFFCDICHREVPSQQDLKKLCISAIVTDNCLDDPVRTCTSLTIEMCRACFTKNEPILRKEIEGLPNFLKATK